MPHYEIERRIAASADDIWRVLTDPTQLQDGTFSILEIKGHIADGETIRLRSEADPKRTFAINVSQVEPGRRMVWSNGLPLGLFLGSRKFELTPEGDVTCLLYTSPSPRDA